MKILRPLLLAAGAACLRGTATPLEAPPVILDAIAVRNLGIESVTVEPTTFSRTAFALGEIEPLPARRGVLSSRVAGRALEVLAHEGDAVKKGQVLARVESRQPGSPPPVLDLPSPLDGLVWESALVPGQPVEPDAALLTVLDLAEVRARVRVPDTAAARLSPGARVQLRVPALGGTPLDATFDGSHWRGEAHAAVVEVFFRLPNPDLRLRPGMRVEATLETERREEVVSVPRDALQGDGVSRFVFVRHFELTNAFERVPVVVGESGGDRVEIREGLLPGDEVITRGAYALSFAGRGSVSLKEALDAAHGHAHNEDGSEMSEAPGPGKDSGHAHASAAAPPSRFWPATSGVLGVLLLVSLFRPRARSE
jgi:multidrug efflux pump subunit AcrA (membrane-fusion protein)